MPKLRYEIQCHRDGILQWEDIADNLVTDEGINDLLLKYFKAGITTPAFFLGIVQGASPTFAITDRMATHPGWTEYTTYTENTRQQYILPATWTGKSIDNSASRALFNCSGANNTISGAFLATDATKGGATGVLYSEALFSQGNKLVGPGDIISILATVSGVTQ